MKKTHKVVMLPTEKAELGFNNKGELVTGDTILWSNDAHKAQHLYIISDDEIKKGDWFINEQYFLEEKVELAIWQHNGKIIPNSNPKKIVATTDKSLTISKDGFEGKNWLLNQIHESFINTFIKNYNNGTPITKVNLEMELIPNPNYTGSGDNIILGYKIKTRPDNTVIIHQSKTYSRSNIKDLLKRFSNDYNILTSVDQWIKENL